jgi:hypothetical protein
LVAHGLHGSQHPATVGGVRPTTRVAEVGQLGVPAVVADARGGDRVTLEHSVKEPIGQVVNSSN